MARHQEIRVPDIGDFKDVEVIEVLAKPGDRIEVEDPLITLESDKAAMDVPSPVAGTIEAIKVEVGDRVCAGRPIATVEVDESVGTTEKAPELAAPAEAPPPGRVTEVSVEEMAEAGQPAPPAMPRKAPPVPPVAPVTETFVTIHASPAVQRFARELGVDIGRIQGTGRKGRILEEDVKGYVRQLLSGSAGAAPAVARGIEPIPAQDFSRFGPIEVRPLGRIKKRSGANLHRAWLNLPMVTHHEEVDVTETEAFRKALSQEYKELRVTLLSFLLQATALALKAFPEFNASLDASGENLILKKYCHVGVAVDTPEGLVVPVIRDVDRKGIIGISRELGEFSARAREGRLKAQDLQGACFTISSLGGIGGTAFTPIVNAPEVAILGVTRSRYRPSWQGGRFVPRLMLPLSLSYDHRVIDGAQAARFCVHLAGLLGDVRRLL